MLTFKRRRPKKVVLIIAVTLLIFLAGLGIYLSGVFHFEMEDLTGKDYSYKFNISTIESSVDFNNNEIDDYQDILLGAKKEAEVHPTYNSKYWDTGYPPDDIGVCADLVWRSFKNAGYSLRDMVNLDIKNRQKAYKSINSPDKNIDFRRCRNLRVFFDKYATVLTVDKKAIEEWQPGDIVIFNNNSHIGIVSDKRDSHGYPYILHNMGQPNFEQDYLPNADIDAHYRFDASKVDKSMLIAWHD